MQRGCRIELQPHNLPKLNIATENQGTRCRMLSRVCLRTPRVEELDSSGWGKWQYAHRSPLWQPSVDVCNTHGSQVPSACAAWSASAGRGGFKPTEANFQAPGLYHPLSSNPEKFLLRRISRSICNLNLATSESQKWCHEIYTYKADCVWKKLGLKGFLGIPHLSLQVPILNMIWHSQMQCPAVWIFPPVGN